MAITLTPNGRNWIEKQLSDSGPGTVPEIVAALVATTRTPLTEEDIQVDLSAIETDVVRASLKALRDNKLIVERA